MRTLREHVRRAAFSGYLNLAARLHELRSLSWEATAKCNLSCLHCGANSGPDADAGDELTTAEALAMFASIAADFDSSRIRVSISGGEPLLRRDLLEITAELERLGFSWGLVSNGLLLDQAMLQRCLAGGMGWLSISLDGVKRDHERLRGPGTFAPAVAAIRRAVADPGLQAVEVASVLSARLAARLDAMHALVRSLRVQRWRIMPLIEVGRARGHPELLPSPAAFRSALRWLATVRQTNGAGPEVTFDEAGFLGEEFECRVRPERFICAAGINCAQILADGAVTGCPFVGRMFVQGHVRRQRFSRLWDERFQLFRDRRWTRRGACAGCAHYGECRGGCLLQWESADAGGPRACLAEMLAGGAA